MQQLAEHNATSYTTPRDSIEPVGEDLYRIDNIPWFVRNLAADDVVRATLWEGELWASERVQASGRMTIRVIPLGDADPKQEVQRIFDLVLPLGVNWEGSLPKKLIALDVGPGVDLRALKRLLTSGEADGTLSYEEGCISQEWLAL